MTDIKHIVYDIGQVLISYDPRRAYRDLIPNETERQWFLDNVTTGPWNIEQDRGRSWEEAETLLIEEFPDHEANIRAFRKNWHKMVRGDMDEAVAFYQGLIAAGHDVTLLTNFASDTLEQARGMFPFLNEARGATVSGDVKLIKPDPAIYKLHAKTFDLDPAATIFIDDSLPNVLGARSCGWKAEHFTGVEKWKADLARHGVSI
jgi:2-haloacid dehalogenase